MVEKGLIKFWYYKKNVFGIIDKNFKIKVFINICKISI